MIIALQSLADSQVAAVCLHVVWIAIVWIQIYFEAYVVFNQNGVMEWFIGVAVSFDFRTTLNIENFQHEYFRQNLNFDDNFRVRLFSLERFFAIKFLFLSYFFMISGSQSVHTNS